MLKKSETIREENIDIVKGLAIALVVLGHCGMPGRRVIYLFHMAVFIMASGFCWKEKNVINKENLMKYFIRKLKSLYVPYVIFNTNFLLLYNRFIDWNIYTDNGAFTGVSKSKIGNYSIFNVFLGLIHFSPAGTQELCGADWFVIMLFYDVMAAAIIFAFTHKMKFVVKHIIILGGHFCLVGRMAIAKI